jgi:hypothetical protein
VRLCSLSLRCAALSQWDTSIYAARNISVSLAWVVKRPNEPETVQIILSKLAKLDQLEQAINRQNVTIVPEPETPAQIPETAQDPEARDQPLTLLPAVSGVSPEDVKSVVDAYLSGIAKRNICTYLRWGSGKYSRIVKPVLDQFLAQ